MTPSRERRLGAAGVWHYVTVDENGGGGSLPAGGSTGEVLTKESDADGDVGWEADGGSQTLERVYLPFAFDTPNILTGIVLATLAEGDLLISGGAGAPTEAFDGTTPRAWITPDPTDPVGAPLHSRSLESTGQTFGTTNLFGIPGGLNNEVGSIAVGGTAPIYLIVNDGNNGGDPNDPTPMSQGIGIAALLIARAP